MSDTAAAIKAAREVKADTLAPELYRESTEWFIKARQEYRFKNFEEARNYAKKARRFAEEAEFEAIRSGASRTDAVIPDSLSDRGMSGSSAETNEPPLTPNEYATPTGIPADENLRSSPDETDTTPPSAPLPTPSN